LASFRGQSSTRAYARTPGERGDTERAVSRFEELCIQRAPDGAGYRLRKVRRAIIMAPSKGMPLVVERWAA